MRIACLGTPEFAVPSLEALAAAGHEVACAVCQPDRPAGRGRALREPAVKRWARERGISVLQPDKVRDGRLAADLGRLAPELLAVAAYGRILGKDLLDLAPHGAVNVHGSLLPSFRGAAPIQWAVAEGESETGVTIMQMDEGLDTGDVLLQRAVPIAPEDTAEALSPRLARLGGEALVEALRLLERGQLVPVRQDASRATLAPILGKAHGRADWSLPARRLRDCLRGFPPGPACGPPSTGGSSRSWRPRRWRPRAGRRALPRHRLEGRRSWLRGGLRVGGRCWSPRSRPRASAARVPSSS